MIGSEPAIPLSASGAPAAGDAAFGIDAFTLDDRLRLFHFAAAEKRHEYLWLLRAFDRARANYQVLMHASDAAAVLGQLAAEHPEAATVGDVQVLLDALAEWQVLDRSYDGTRAANLAEYRNRHYVYQFTQAGYRAFRAVEEVLTASLEDAQLSRLVFPDILADLRALAGAVRSCDAAEVYRKLSRLDGVLADMAQRAARFYLMLGDLARTNDTRPEVFLTHKDALLTHMREFHSELTRFAPLLAAAVAEVEATGTDRLARLAAEADESLFRGPEERVADWRARWGGLAQWFGAGQHSEAERLQDATITAIANVTALLRRVTESRRGGVSRESQLRHLAQWFAACPSDDDAHALFQAVFGLGAPRHVSAGARGPGGDRQPAVLVGRRAGGAVPDAGAQRQGGGTARARPDPAQRRGETAAARRAAEGDRAAPRGGRDAGRRRRLRPGTGRAGDPDAAQPARRGAVRAGAGQPDGERVGARGAAHLAARPGRHDRAHGPRPAASGRPGGGGHRMRVAADVSPLELAEYQKAARLVLRHPLITASYPDSSALPLVRRWVRQLRTDFGEVLGYTLLSSGDTIRLRRAQDTLDGTRPAVTRARRPFDRRRYAYLVLALSALGRSGAQIALSELADAVAADAGRIDGVGMDTGRKPDRDAFVDAVAWLEARGALRMADGSAVEWVNDPERAEALYDIDRQVVGAIYAPSRVLQHLNSVTELLDGPGGGLAGGTAPAQGLAAQRRGNARRARRLVLEHPVIYYADVDGELRGQLRSAGLAEDIERLTGLGLERRAEGVALISAGQRFTDVAFPSTGTVAQAALLLCARIAGYLRHHSARIERLPAATAAERVAEAARRIDAALPDRGRAASPRALLAEEALLAGQAGWPGTGDAGTAAGPLRLSGAGRRPPKPPIRSCPRHGYAPSCASWSRTSVPEWRRNRPPTPVTC